jgi:hypothetical protein
MAQCFIYQLYVKYNSRPIRFTQRKFIKPALVAGFALNAGPVSI